jgi:hypothetical protein
MTINLKVCIDDVAYSVSDHVVTGQQLLDLANKRPTTEFLIFQLLNNGQIEEIRLDETTDLKKQGIEKFITFRSDRSFFFLLDGRRFQWGASLITGFQLKKLANVDPKTYGVWQEVKGAEDLELSDTQQVSLEPKGLERFFTGKKATTEG